MTEIVTYDLLIEPWIPVVTLKMEAKKVSIREVLEEAHHLREIGAEMPHINAALLRLLLAILHRVFGPADPQEWNTLWQCGQFDQAALEKYFADQPYFNLFDAGRPFLQNRHPLVEKDLVQGLRQLIGGGDTYSLFDHIMDDTPVVMNPDEAARLLVTAHSFGLAGLRHPQYKLFYTDAPNSRAISFFVEGQNLFETLMFNLVRYNPSEPFKIDLDDPDRPFWEVADPYQPERSSPLGYLDYLTWPNRKIMLFPEKVAGAVKVTGVTLAPGLTLSSEVHNPMYHYRSEPGKKKGEMILRVTRFREEHALWRDSYALINLTDSSIEPPKAIRWMKELVDEGILPEDMLFQCAAYGMCTEPGKQKVNFYRGERFTLNNKLLNDPALLGVLGQALNYAENLRTELWGTFFQLASRVIAFQADEEGGHKPDKNDVQNLMRHWDAEGLFWGTLEVMFYRFLSRLMTDPEGALAEWKEELRKAAWMAYDQTVNGLGFSKNAIKAAAKTHSRMAYGIKKTLGNPKEEEHE